jgi:uncharacterized protein
MLVFENAGKQNTEATLEAARKAVFEREIRYFVVATTTGETGAKAARLFADSPAKVIAVTHNAGFNKDGVPELAPEFRDEIARFGAVLHTGTIITRGLGAAIKEKFGGFSHEQIVAATLRIFGQGVKVCVEMAAMVTDAGLVPQGETIVAVAGTGRGADTCLVAFASPSNRFFDIKVREILAKPVNF